MCFMAAQLKGVNVLYGLPTEHVNIFVRLWHPPAGLDEVVEDGSQASCCDKKHSDGAS